MSADVCAGTRPVNTPRSALHCETQGAGPDVVLLHGWGLHGGIWTRIVRALADEFRVTCPDLPGHGRSAASVARTLQSAAQQVADSAPRGATWIGWSWGAMVALQAAASDLADIARLVLVASTPRFVQGADWTCAVPAAVVRDFVAGLEREPEATLQRFLALQTRGAEHAQAVLRSLRASLNAHGRPDAQGLRDGLAMLAGADLRPLLASVACPVLLIMGGRDTLVPGGAADAMLGALRTARLERIEGAGHAPFLSHEARFLAALRAFLHD